ncbi:hypothetical protein CA54_16660 [Symmachiella macrocystis]|uniref:Uncharacterized protein n=1 Tax=Symmachiella macrocystis TaxID=2527985 RepID=A0A5C6BL68_9PLAN|nr:hypothetical protein [Symmachiella macrocystis]TWU12840.1 hypothetical protein CA54_16660 [Symmachiella macrocystis]
MQKGKFISGLGFVNAAVFVMLFIFLPRNNEIVYLSWDWASFYINTVNWNLLFGILIASLLVSVGAYFLVDSLQAKPQEDT